MTKPQIELLAPGGDIDSIKAAIAAGADAVYCGVNGFNARSRAKNIAFDDLQGIIKLAHENECKVFLTLNIIILEKELRALINLLNKLIHTKIDAIIVQDLGLLYLLQKHYKELPVHASTQLTTHNKGQIDFLHKMGVERVNLCRELNLDEIRALTSHSHKQQIETEVFVHGAYCISFSGLCYMSSVLSGKSGNRGRCSQPCRDRYNTTETGNKHPLNLKDNSALYELEKLSNTGVDSLKIEGRMKGFDYVYTVVDTYRKQLDNQLGESGITCEPYNLYTVFNREFSSAFLTGKIHKDQFTDNPKDYLLQRYKISNDSKPDETLLAEKKRYTRKKNELSTIARNKMAELELASVPFQMPPADKREKLLTLPTLENKKRPTPQPKLSALISSKKDLSLLDTQDIDVCFQLPSCFAKGADEYVTFFNENKRLIPWFPPLLIGKDYEIATQILENIKPQFIVSNNLGIGIEATRVKTPWVAGPYMNLANSYSLLCLKENFHCLGAFISSELNKKQIEAIVPPTNFNLYFSIYHPVQLMTSRQCLHQQVTGCKIDRVNQKCLTHCNKTATLTCKDKKAQYINKLSERYHSIHNAHNYLNTAIISDIPNTFTNYLIDLRDITTGTELTIDKKEIVALFKGSIAGNSAATQRLHEVISPTICTQFTKGI